MNKIKIWGDTRVTNFISVEKFFDIVENMRDEFTICVTDTIDMAPFQKEPERFLSLVKEGRIEVHSWNGAAAQFEKDFYMSSIKRLIRKGELFEVIPNAEELIELIDSVAIPKESWIKKDFQWKSFPLESIQEIGLGSKATRSDVLAACEKLGREDIWKEYDFNYQNNLRIQHRCEGWLNEDGTFTIFVRK